MNKRHITLGEADRSYLVALLKKGSLGVKQYQRATGLLELDWGKRLTEVAATLGVRYVTVSAWRDGYRRGAWRYCRISRAPVVRLRLMAANARS